jgi:hypothetical protein
MHVTRMLLAEFKQTLASAGYASHRNLSRAALTRVH